MAPRKLPSEGIRLTDQRLNPEEASRWKALRVKFGFDGRGADRNTLLACMAAAEGLKPMTNRQLLDELARRLRA